MNDFGSVVCGRQNTPYQAPVSVDIRLIRDTNLSVLGLSFLLLLQRLRIGAGVGAGSTTHHLSRTNTVPLPAQIGASYKLSASYVQAVSSNVSRIKMPPADVF